MFRKLLIGPAAAFTLGITSLGFASTSASAEVVNNVRFESLGYKLVNPCNGLTITLSGEVHMLWYTTPEGHTIMRYNTQRTGFDTAGTEYLVNIRRVMDHAQWPIMYPFSDLLTFNAVSLGSEDNFRLTVSIDEATGPSSEYTVESVCRG
jgi:hypothetical protein